MLGFSVWKDGACNTIIQNRLVCIIFVVTLLSQTDSNQSLRILSITERSFKRWRHLAKNTLWVKTLWSWYPAYRKSMADGLEDLQTKHSRQLGTLCVQSWKQEKLKLKGGNLWKGRGQSWRIKWAAATIRSANIFVGGKLGSQRRLESVIK